MYPLRVAVVIPAHNEQDAIETTVRCFINQSYPVDNIVVVNDCSIDGTSQILEKLLLKFSPKLIVVINHVPGLRAGAVNYGLKQLKSRVTDIVIVADADSQFDFHLVEEAVKSFEEKGLGGVCSIAGVLDLEPAPKGIPILRRFERWILWRLQRLEYAGFDAERTQTHESVLILHGLCSAYNFRLVKGLGGLSLNHLIEDYDMTLKIKEAGTRTIFNPRMKAYTKVPERLSALIRQRLRWMRGGVDVLMQHGYNKYTRGDFLNHFLFIALLLGVLLTVGIGVAQGGWRLAFNNSPIPILLAIFGYAVSLYKLRYLERVDVTDALIRVIIVPEFIMAILLSGVQLYAYFLAFSHRKQGW